MNKYFKAFFGVAPKSIKPAVVISPIIYPKQFEKISGKKGKHYKSILGYLLANFKGMTFIKTPMTQSAVFDLVVMLCQTGAKKIIFIGAIGGIEKGLRIGDVLLLNSAREIYSVKSMHEETDEKLKSLRKKGIFGVDFETKAFFSAARRARLSAMVALVVTDLPLKKPFYLKKTKKEETEIHAAIEYIIQSV